MCRDEQQCQVYGHSHTKGALDLVVDTLGNLKSHSDIRTETTIMLRSVMIVFSAFSKVLLDSAQAETKDKKYSFVDLFRTPNIRKRSVCLGIVW